MRHLIVFTTALLAFVIGLVVATPFVIGHRLYVLCRRRKPQVVRCTDGTYLIEGELV